MTTRLEAGIKPSEQSITGYHADTDSRGTRVNPEETHPDTGKKNAPILYRQYHDFWDEATCCTTMPFLNSLVYLF